MASIITIREASRGLWRQSAGERELNLFRKQSDNPWHHDRNHGSGVVRNGLQSLSGTEEQKPLFLAALAESIVTCEALLPRSFGNEGIHFLSMI